MTLPRFELDDWFAAAEGRFDLSLGHSACQSIAAHEFLDPDDLADLAREPLGYGAFDGLAELRQAIAERYTSIEPSHTTTFNGPSEAIYTFTRATLRAGDRVVVPAPSFQLLHAVARHVGCEVVEWRPNDPFACTFDVDDLAALCDRPTKLIVVNFPHNPSGSTITEADLRRVVAIAESVGATLFSDEVFRLLELPPTRTLPAACELSDRAVSVSGLSKPYGLGGLRIGWLATRDDAIREAVKQYRYYTTETTNTPCQRLACHALRRGDELLDRNRTRIGANLRLLAAFVDSTAGVLELSPPSAGTMALVRQRTGTPSTEFCERILDEERLFLVPGRVLGMSDDLLRVGLGMADFERGLERIGRFLCRRG